MLRTEFKSSAKTIGMGKVMIIDIIDRYTVLKTVRLNWYDWKKRTRYSKPTHGESRIPSRGLYFLKAIVTPYMGQYLKTISHTMGIKRTRETARFVQTAFTCILNYRALVAQCQAVNAKIKSN